MKYRNISIVLSALASLIVSGCGDSGPELADVTGKVTLNGTPVPYAFVRFQPITPRGTYASAYTNAEGEYTLLFSRSANGAIVGQHSVTVRTSGKDEIEIEDRNTGLMTVPPLPDGYLEHLQVEFEREVQSGSNVHDFEISPSQLTPPPESHVSQREESSELQ